MSPSACQNQDNFVDSQMPVGQTPTVPSIQTTILSPRINIVEIPE